MCHRLLADARLYEFLWKIDVDLAETARSEGCRECGARVHRGAFPRQPRGFDKLGPEYDRRLSFCCSRRECRKRLTPPSVRFLGRRVYLGAVVVLASVMRSGPRPMRVAELEKLVGASRRTIERWRRWWSEVFARSPFWKAMSGRFIPPVGRDELVCSLLARFTGDERDRLVGMLRFLAPITTGSWRGAMAI